jgi:hypothetical protein
MTRSLAVLALALLVSCGGANPKDCATAASTALSKGDAVEAQKCAEMGLAAPGASSDPNNSWTLERVRLEALAMQGEAAKVTTELERLNKSYAAQVKADLYANLARELVNAKKVTEGLQLVEAGKKKFPDKVEVFNQYIETLKQEAAKGNNNELTQGLSQLGYIGGNTPKPKSTEPAPAPAAPEKPVKP